MTEDWTKQWERRTVNGVYPLRRFLGRSNHSVVFLTECVARNVPQAAIKIMPANPAVTEAQLGHWKTVATLSHPHLIRLLDSGRCELGGHHFLFVVTDLAEQNLAQILPSRPLTPDEVRELLTPTLDALAYLHPKNLVHGGLRPPNFLVIGDQLKLASDAIRPAGERSASTARPSLYDPPEAKKSRLSTAGDVWALGITLTEALTQTAPSWSRENSDSVPLPATLPPEFLDIVQRCLNRNPERRPTIAQLIAHFKQAPPPAPPRTASPPTVPPSAVPPAAVSPSAVSPSATPAAVPAAATTPSATTPSAAMPPVTSEPQVQTLATANSRTPRLRLIAITVGLIAACGVWMAAHRYHNQSVVAQSAAIPRPPPAVAPPPNVAATKTDIAAPPPAVLYQENPTISRSARESIRGIIKITARVSVDRSGSVVAATLANRASSKYFDRSALEAAKKWKFSPSPEAASRTGLLHFEFTRAGVTSHADALR